MRREEVYVCVRVFPCVCVASGRMTFKACVGKGVCSHAYVSGKGVCACFRRLCLAEDLLTGYVSCACRCVRACSCEVKGCAYVRGVWVCGTAGVRECTCVSAYACRRVRNTTAQRVGQKDSS